MKRIVIFVLAALMLLSVACSAEPAADKTAGARRRTENTTSRPTEQTGSKPTAKPTRKPTPEPTPKPTPAVSVDWTELVLPYTDEQGYTYEITIRLSPFILLSNTDILEKAWSEVSRGRELPSYDSWYVQPGIYGYPTLYANAYDTNWNTDMLCTDGLSDMYYSVGSISIRNTTEGWSITEQNARDVVIPMRYGADKDLNTGTDHFGFLGCRIIYSNQTQTFLRGLRVDAYMSKDKWGPSPFVLMAAEVFSPNFPNGAYYDFLLNHVTIGGTRDTWIKQVVPETRLGVIGKDGKYVRP